MEAAAAQACHLPLAQHVRMLVLGNCPSTLRGYPTVHRLTSEPVVVVVMEAVVEAAAAAVAVAAVTEAVAVASPVVVSQVVVASLALR